MYRWGTFEVESYCMRLVLIIVFIMVYSWSHRRKSRKYIRFYHNHLVHQFLRIHPSQEILLTKKNLHAEERYSTVPRAYHSDSAH